MSSNGTLVVCQSGFEGLLVREMENLGLPASENGPGWALAAETAAGAGNLRSAAFPHVILESAVPVAGGRVNELAQGVMDLFAESLKGERIEAPWPCVFAGGQDVSGLGRRVSSVEAAFQELLARRLGRVAKLASPQR